MSHKRQQKRTKIQKYMYRDTMNVDHEVYDYPGNNWCHQYSNKRGKKNLGAIPGKHSLDSLQKTAIVGTSHMIQKVLQPAT
jgi:hypothetical protein